MKVFVPGASGHVGSQLVPVLLDGGHEVVAAQGDAGHLLVTVAGHRPDLVLLDIRMPPTFTDEGARAAKAVKDAHPDVGVLVLSQHVEISHIVDLVRLGGFGYLLKDRVADVTEFVDAVRRGGGGGTPPDPPGVSPLLVPRRRAHPPSPPTAPWRPPPARRLSSPADTARRRDRPISSATRC